MCFCPRVTTQQQDVLSTCCLYRLMYVFQPNCALYSSMNSTNIDKACLHISSSISSSRGHVMTKILNQYIVDTTQMNKTIYLARWWSSLHMQIICFTLHISLTSPFHLQLAVNYLCSFVLGVQLQLGSQALLYSLQLSTRVCAAAMEQQGNTELPGMMQRSTTWMLRLLFSHI